MNAPPRSVVAGLLRVMRQVARSPVELAPVVVGQALQDLLPSRIACIALMHRAWAKVQVLAPPLDDWWKTLHVDAPDSVVVDAADFALQLDPAFRDPTLMRLAQIEAPTTLWFDDERRREPGRWVQPRHEEMVGRFDSPDRLYAACPLQQASDWVLMIVLARGGRETPFTPVDAATLRLLNDEVVSLIATELTPGTVSTAALDSADHIAALTGAQRRLLPLLAQGLSESDIAAKIFRSRHTVHDHVKQIYKTLNVSSRFDLVLRYGAVLSTLPTAAVGV